MLFLWICVTVLGNTKRRQCWGAKRRIYHVYRFIRFPISMSRDRVFLTREVPLCSTLIRYTDICNPNINIIPFNWSNSFENLPSHIDESSEWYYLFLTGPEYHKLTRTKEDRQMLLFVTHNLSFKPTIPFFFSNGKTKDDVNHPNHSLFEPSWG